MNSNPHKRIIAILDDNIPLWNILYSSNIVEPFNKLPIVKKLENANLIIILAELKHERKDRSECEGLQYIRKIRIWNRIVTPIIVVSFFKTTYLSSKTDWKRLLHLADSHLRLPLSLANLEYKVPIKKEDLEIKKRMFINGHVDFELTKLIGDLLHRSDFYRQLKSLYKSKNENQNKQFLNKLNFLMTLLRESNLTSTILEDWFTKVELYFNNDQEDKPEESLIVDILKIAGV